MKSWLFFHVIIFSISSITFSQSTFLKVIDNLKDDERISTITEITPDLYLCNIHQIDQNFNLPMTDFGYKHVLYLLNESGNIVHSLNFNNLDQYFIIVRNVIKAENNDVLFLCDALDSLTLDIQLCLLHTDFNLNILSYGFYGSPDTIEYITDYCINDNQNIVFAGHSGYDPFEDQKFLLWETDYAGNTINYKIDTNYYQSIATIVELQGTAKYQVGNGGNGIFICNHDFNVEAFKWFETDTTGFIGFPFKKFKLIDDFHYLMLGWQLDNGSGNPGNPWDMAFYKIDENFNINNKYIYGALDTNDFPNNVDFIDTNRIFLAGVKNYTNQPPEDSWMSIYITNLQGDTLNNRFYGGYGCYDVGTGLATSDGGYIYAVRWFDFANYTPPDPIDWDIVIMKVNSEGLLTNINSHIPFEVTDIIIYPNPGSDYLRICSSYKQVQVLIYDLTGKCVIDKFTSGSSSISTSDLKTGSYLYRLLNGEREIKSGKWVKK